MVVMMFRVGGLRSGWFSERLLEYGWLVVAVMVGKYVSMVVWDRRRRDLLVRAG